MFPVIEFSVLIIMLPSPLHFAACLPRIDHWDHDQECTVCLTDKCILLIGLSFITEKIQSTKRVPLSAIHTMRLGNLVSAHLSLLP